MRRKHLLSYLVAGIAAFLTAGTAMAQSDQNDADERAIEEVVVTGVRYSLSQAVEVKRNSMQIVDALVAEDLGKFPDNNVVEAMQRIPGVQVTNRGAGEVSTVSIRGLSDVTTTVNGRNIFTSSGRSVALADIPSTLINRVDVYKTRSPEQIARGIAGQIDVHTNRPFDFDGLKVAVQTRAIFAEQADDIDPQVSALLSNRWNTDIGAIGALFNVSHTTTNWLDQGVHAGASVPFRPPEHPTEPLLRLFPDAFPWTPGLDNGLPTEPGSTLDLSPTVEFVHARDAVFQPHVRGERERPAWNTSLQWAPNGWSEYHFEAFYNGYRNTQHNSLFFTFVDWWGSVDPNDPVELYPGTNVIKSRFVNDAYTFTSGDVLEEKTDSYVYALGGSWDFFDSLNIKSEIVYQESQFEDEFFALRVDKGTPRLFVDFNTGSGVPYLEFFDNPGTPVDEGDLTDPNLWNLANLYDNGQLDDGNAATLTIDADWTTELGWIKTISFGLRYDERSANEYSFNSGDLHCNDAPGCAGNSVNDFSGLMGVTTGHFDGQAPVLTEWAIPTQDGLLGNRTAMREAWGYAPAGMKNFLDEFQIEESKTALYAQADFSTDTVSGFIDGRFGFRFLDQQTDTSFRVQETGGRASAENSNSVVLPSLMVRWGITDELMARLSYTETFNLPDFGQLNPFINYAPDVTNIGYGTATGGNADLEPERSRNLDLSLEWYFAEGSVVYGTYFRRDIYDAIVNFANIVQYDVPDDNPDRGVYPFVLSQPDNTGDSTLDGWEFGATWFPELEGWFDGLGVQTSVTILDSEREIPVLNDDGTLNRIDVLSIFGVSDTSYSAILAYDREMFSARLSWFWRDDFLDRNENRQFANPLGIYKSAEESLDFQATWTVNDQWTLTFDAVNLTDPVFNENYGDNPMIFNHVNNYFSRSFAFGVRFQY